MLAGKEFDHLTKFMVNASWRDAYKVVLYDHFGNDRETAMALQWSLFMWACAVDDFLTREFGPENRNLIDDYLRRRGYRVSATAKSYLQGLRTTVMSVYEVTGVSAATFAVRDIIRDDAETTITRTAHIRDIRKRDRIATRIVPVRGGHVLANGTMPFPGQMDEMLMAVLQEAAGGSVGQRPPTITEMLRVSAHVFSIVFLLNGLDGRLDRNWQDRLHKSPFTPPVNALRRDPVGALFI